ncbi:DUF5786 family protein [Natronorarus salvus]|uniref:DUF5786 family protein n=1 Tax=Natronorarus salvus TaxID=3117733 RepID=UPI002F2640D2
MGFGSYDESEQGKHEIKDDEDEGSVDVRENDHQGSMNVDNGGSTEDLLDQLQRIKGADEE